MISRISMAAPGMIILPVIMERLEKRTWFNKFKSMHAPFQIMMIGCFLTVMVPAACALFPQQCAIKISTIRRFEKDLYNEMVEKNNGELPEIVYFNKGL